MEHPVGAPVALGGFHLKCSGGKREQVGRNRLGFRVTDANPISLRLPGYLRPVGDCFPTGRNHQLQRVPRLEVRLVEARKCKMRSCRHEQRIHELRVPVEGCIAGPKDDLHGVLAGDEFVRWNDDVIVDSPELRGGSARRHRRQEIPARCEIQHEGSRRLRQSEPDGRAPGNPLRSFRRNLEGKIVTKIFDSPCARGCQLESDSRFRIGVVDVRVPATGHESHKQHC